MESIASPPSRIVGSGSFLTPLIISIIGIISTSIILLVYHYILIKYCFRRQQPTTNFSDQPVQERPLPTGVDQKVLETIPIISYAIEKGHIFRIDQTECVVCLGELERGEMVRLLPTCKHAFHVPCIDKWFVAHNSCPICRYPMEEPVNMEAPTLPPSVEESRRVQPPPDQEHEQGLNVNIAAASSSGKQSCSLLRHCASLVLPVDRKQSRRRLITGLKRSLSMDQSSVIIDIQKDQSNNKDSSPSSSSKDDSVTRRLYRARSIKHLDRVSAKLLSSFSRLHMGRNSEILPY